MQYTCENKCKIENGNLRMRWLSWVFSRIAFVMFAFHRGILKTCLDSSAQDTNCSFQADAATTIRRNKATLICFLSTFVRLIWNMVPTTERNNHVKKYRITSPMQASVAWLH